MEPVASITITLMKNGQIGVSGPINQKALCYGLLETAKDVVRDHKAEAQPELVLARGSLPNGPVPVITPRR